MVRKSCIIDSTPRRKLHEWLSNPPGSRLLNTEVKLLDDFLPHLFGYHLLQVGRLGNADLLTHSRISHRIVVEVDGDRNISDYPTIRAEPDTLPIASDTIDVIILPHVLEFSPHMQETVQEAKRVLVPEGHLVIFTFNFWSLMGIWQLLFGGEGEVPWFPCQGGKFPGFGRLKNWMALAGFDIISIKRYFFRPPGRIGSFMNHGSPSDPLRFLDTMGPRFWPFLCGAYLFVAKKRVTTLTPRKLSWQRPERSFIAVGLGGSSS
uniref:Ubiquinone/menaquinone biosynthesis C-methylase UbiE n=1 Tax=Candidatus Kentrum sp. TUN TaxID=2126343 RepID=A0A451A4V7_9GAMM|nr:MAG: Ubiquinone/menaquinone biosynthesis C-methylase UbiE [Candidatus Kentron sp. TUN]